LLLAFRGSVQADARAAAFSERHDSDTGFEVMAEGGVAGTMRARSAEWWSGGEEAKSRDDGAA
jgi:hypothetical protein